MLAIIIFEMIANATFEMLTHVSFYCLRLQNHVKYYMGANVCLIGIKPLVVHRTTQMIWPTLDGSQQSYGNLLPMLPIFISGTPSYGPAAGDLK